MVRLSAVSIPTRVTLLLTFSAVTGFILRVRQTPLSGYEPSVYTGLWHELGVFVTLLVVLYAVAIIAIFHTDNVADVVASVVGIMTINTMVFILPALRGYFFYGRSDPTTIVDIIRSLIETGVVAPGNVYPATHLLAASMASIADTDVKFVVFVLPLVFALLFPVFVYPLATSVFDRRRRILTAVVSATVLLLAYRQSYMLFDQQTMGVIYVSFILYLMAGALAGRRHFLALLALTIAVLGVFHPVPPLLFVLTIAAVLGLGYSGVLPQRSGSEGLLVSIGTLVGILLVEWFYFIGFFGRVVGRVSGFVLGRLSNAAVNRNVTAIEGFDPEALVSLLFVTMGHVILFGLLSGVAVVLFIGRWRRRGGTRTVGAMVVIVVWFVVVAIVQVLHVVLGIFNLFIYRFVGPAVVVAPILAAVTLDDVARGWSGRLHGLVLVIIILVFACAAPVGLLAVHPSPHTHGVNQQLTASEVSSANWMIDTVPAENGTLIQGVVTRPFRLADYERGVRWRKHDERFTRRGFRIQPHFGYESPREEPTSIRSGSVVVISGADRYAITHDSGLWSNYRPADYARFKRDPTVAKSYANGVTSVYQVQ